MRLTCPNCGAQYEVPQDVIPAAGRDVQCSNCAHTWFEGPDGMAPPAARRSPPPPPPPRAAEPEPDPTPEPEPEPEPTPEAEPELAEDPDGEADLVWDEPEEEPEALAEDVDEEDDAPESPLPPPRPGLDPSVTSILREEAQREAAARSAASETFERQEDLDLQNDAIADLLAEEAEQSLDQEARQAEETRRRMARLKGENAPPTSASTNGQGASSELFPDIEEINSSLEPTADAAASDLEDDTPEGRERRHRSGFRMGFGIVGLIAAALAGIYLLAPQIARTVPSLAPSLERYVAMVNDGRLWLDLRLQEATAALAGDEAPATSESDTPSEG